MTGKRQELGPTRRRRSFSAEFKADAFTLFRDEDRTIVKVARSFGVGDGMLGNWVHQGRIGRGKKSGLTTSERTELGEFRG